MHSLNKKQKLTVSYFLNEMAFLIASTAPLKSKFHEAAERFRLSLFSSCHAEQIKFYTTCRDILVELATLLAKQQGLDNLMLTLAYIRSLNKGEVLIATDEKVLSPQEDYQTLADSCA